MHPADRARRARVCQKLVGGVKRSGPEPGISALGRPSRTVNGSGERAWVVAHTKNIRRRARTVMPTKQDHAAGANLARDARRSPGAGWRWPGSIGAVRVAACRASCEGAVKPPRTDISCTTGALRRQGMNTNLNPDYTRVRHGQSVRRGGFALQSVSPCRCPRGRKGPATAIVLPAASGEGGEVSLRSG